MSKTVYYLRKGKQYDHDYEVFLRAGASPDDIFSDRIQDRKKQAAIIIGLKRCLTLRESLFRLSQF